MSIFGTGKPKIKPYPKGISAFTANATTETLTITNHGLKTGRQVGLTTTDTLPAPLEVYTAAKYYVIYVDEDSFQLATTIDNAYAGTEINITDTGTGTHSCDKSPLTLTLHNAKILKDEAIPDIIVHNSEISGHRSYVDRGQHWVFEVLIHLYKDEVDAQTVSSVDAIEDYLHFASVHGFIDDDPVTVASTGTLPDTLDENTVYYVNYVDTDTIQLAPTPDGTSINWTTEGTGTITVTAADHLVTYRTLYNWLNDEVILWRHLDGYPFLVPGVDDPDSLADADYALFRFESMKPVYLTYPGHKDGLKLVFKSVDYVDLYWNAGAF